MSLFTPSKIGPPNFKLGSTLCSAVADDRVFVPWIDRGTERVRLGAVCSVSNNVVEFAVFGCRSDVKFLDGVTQAVATIPRAMRVASFRGLGHPDSHPPRRQRVARQLEGYFPAFAVRDGTSGKGDPGSRSGFANRIQTSPILDQITFRIRIRPIDLNGVDILQACEVHNNPLRMQCVVLARVSFRQVRIALPVGADVAVGKTRVAAPVGLRKSCMRQRISKRMTNEFRGRSIANEIALLTGLSPRALGVPVPGFHV